jgi:hypothetical protein
MDDFKIAGRDSSGQRAGVRGVRDMEVTIREFSFFIA